MKLQSYCHSSNDNSEATSILFEISPDQAKALLAAWEDAKVLLEKHGKYFGYVAIEFAGIGEVFTRQPADPNFEVIALDTPADWEMPDKFLCRTECWRMEIHSDGNFRLSCMCKYGPDKFYSDRIALEQMRVLAAGSNPFPVIPLDPEFLEECAEQPGRN